MKARAEKALATLGDPVPVEPVEGLLNLIAISNGHVMVLREKVNAMQAGELVWGDVEYTEDEERGERRTERAGANVWLRLYNEERDRLANLCATATKLGIEERQIKLAEVLGHQLVRVLRLQADKILKSLVAEGWLEEELWEVWPALTNRVIPEALNELGTAEVEEDDDGQYDMAATDR